MIYADNAATTALDIDAFEAMKPFLLSQYGNASQPYSFSRSARNALKLSRERIAKCINANPDEIYFTSGGTESDNWALKGIALEDKKKTIITSKIEHHAILNTCASLERKGINVIYIPVDCKGKIIENSFENEVKNNNYALSSIMFANNEIGTIQPIKHLCDIAHKYGHIFHTDAVQAIGHIKVDVKELDIDMLSASAHKFNGPKGIGFLYIKNGIKIAPYIDGGQQENKLRSGTENIASIVGMSIALEKNCKQIENNTNKLTKLEYILLRELKLKKIDFIRNGADNHIPGNLSLSFKNSSGEMLLHRLDLMGICVSTGSACNSKNTSISHVLKSISIPIEYANGTIRISFGSNNKINDANIIANAISKIIKG